MPEVLERRRASVWQGPQPGLCLVAGNCLAWQIDMGQRKVNLLRRDNYCILFAIAQVSQMLLRGLRGLPGPSEIRIEDERFPDWDDLTTYSRGAGLEAWQVKRQTTAVKADVFANYLISLHQQPEIQLGNLAFMDLVEVEGVGTLRSLSSLVDDRLAVSNSDLSTLIRILSKAERMWVVACAGMVQEPEESALRLLSRLRVHRLGHERDLEARILEILSSISNNPKDLANALQQHLLSNADSANRFTIEGVRAVADPYLSEPLELRRGESPRPYLNPRLIVEDLDSAGARFSIIVTNTGATSANELLFSTQAKGAAHFQGKNPFPRTVMPGASTMFLSAPVRVPIEKGLQLQLTYTTISEGGLRRFVDTYRFVPPTPLSRLRLGVELPPQFSGSEEVDPKALPDSQMKDHLERALNMPTGSTFVVFIETGPFEVTNAAGDRRFRFGVEPGEASFESGHLRVTSPVVNTGGVHVAVLAWDEGRVKLRVDRGPIARAGDSLG